ncbi:unnamed protein product [Hymenolepis diminuta]|uniref:Uncharacterized protein n=1 Tax=Hymenolepis diminuta TaxID=6216 RepID=A0A564XWE9_HYMDI|nr:unnamed protein product [Hymenolepis diminuta]
MFLYLILSNHILKFPILQLLKISLQMFLSSFMILNLASSLNCGVINTNMCSQ